MPAARSTGFSTGPGIEVLKVREREVGDKEGVDRKNGGRERVVLGGAALVQDSPTDGHPGGVLPCLRRRGTYHAALTRPTMRRLTIIRRCTQNPRAVLVWLVARVSASQGGVLSVCSYRSAGSCCCCNSSGKSAAKTLARPASAISYARRLYPRHASD